jgi:hypothetical protein
MHALLLRFICLPPLLRLWQRTGSCHRDDHDDNNSYELSSKGVVHLVILIHGLQGNDMELAYFQESLERQALQQQKSHKQPQQIVVHSAKCNLGRTSDGITKGGGPLGAGS